jgi:hypothetical protein
MVMVIGGLSAIRSPGRNSHVWENLHLTNKLAVPILNPRPAARAYLLPGSDNRAELYDEGTHIR